MKARFFSIFLLVLFMLVSAVMVGQEISDPEPIIAFNFWGLALGLAKYIFIGMLLTAVNHIMAFTFDIKLWLGDTLLPGIYAYLASLLLAVIDIWFPQLDFLVQTIVGQEVDVNDYGNLAIVGIVLVGVIKGVIKRQHTQEKVAKA